MVLNLWAILYKIYGCRPVLKVLDSALIYSRVISLGSVHCLDTQGTRESPSTFLAEPLRSVLHIPVQHLQSKGTLIVSNGRSEQHKMLDFIYYIENEYACYYKLWFVRSSKSLSALS
jgi:hypothetical protein